MADDVSLTYEKLFDIHRKEKGSSELQKLDKEFFHNVISYINDKKNSMSNKTNGEIFSKSDKETNEKQLNNIKKLITDIYARREQKIVNLAIIKSRTNSNLIDTSALLDSEKVLFNMLVNVLNEYKHKMLINVLAGREPEELNFDSSCLNECHTHHDTETSTENKENSSDSNKIKVQFLSDVPKFVGKELEMYGPYSKEQVVSLPMEIASVLVKKGRVKEV